MGDSRSRTKPSLRWWIANFSMGKTFKEMLGEVLWKSTSLAGEIFHFFQCLFGFKLWRHVFTGIQAWRQQSQDGIEEKTSNWLLLTFMCGIFIQVSQNSINLVRGNFDGTKPMMSFPKAATQWKFDCSWIQDSSEPMPIQPWGCYENAKQAWPLENGFRSKPRVEPTRTWRYKNQTCRLGTIIAELMEGCWRLGNFSSLFTMANNIYICIFRRKLCKKSEISTRLKMLWKSRRPGGTMIGWSPTIVAQKIFIWRFPTPIHQFY